MLESDDDRIIVSTTKAHAGATGNLVRTVLLSSLVVAILLMIVIAAITTH
jgi:hypothetical protein